MELTLNSHELANIFKDLPNENLVETDSHILRQSLRVNQEPSYIIHTVKFLSKLKNISFDDLSILTTNNFFNLFGKLS